MVMHWNDKTDVRLFLHVLKIHNVKLNYEALAAAMGSSVTAKAISHRVSKLRAIAASEDAETTSKTSGARAKGRAKGARVVDGKKRTSNGSCKVPSLVEGGEGSSVGKGNGAVKTENGLGALEEARMGKRVKIVDGRLVVDRAGSDGHEEDGDPEIGGAVKSEGAGERLEDQIAREMGAAVETV